MHETPFSYKNALCTFTAILFSVQYYYMYASEYILTFPKLPFPRRDRKLKSEKRMTSWWMTSGFSTEMRCFSSRETDCSQNTTCTHYKPLNIGRRTTYCSCITFCDIDKATTMSTTCLLKLSFNGLLSISGFNEARDDGDDNRISLTLSKSSASNSK